MTLHRRILLRSDNTFLEPLGEALGEDSTWMTLCRRAFGLPHEVEEQPLRGQVRAGLALYAVTAAIIQRTLAESQAELVRSATESIEAIVGTNLDGTA